MAPRGTCKRPVASTVPPTKQAKLTKKELDKIEHQELSLTDKIKLYRQKVSEGVDDPSDGVFTIEDFRKIYGRYSTAREGIGETKEKAREDWEKGCCFQEAEREKTGSGPRLLHRSEAQQPVHGDCVEVGVARDQDSSYCVGQLAQVQG